jgi:hypothetical protein
MAAIIAVAALRQTKVRTNTDITEDKASGRAVPIQTEKGIVPLLLITVQVP